LIDDVALSRARAQYFVDAERVVAGLQVEWEAAKPRVTVPLTGIASVDKMVDFFRFWVVNSVNFPESSPAAAAE
jgi:hypothetical protein